MRHLPLFTLGASMPMLDSEARHSSRLVQRGCRADDGDMLRTSPHTGGGRWLCALW